MIHDTLENARGAIETRRERRRGSSPKPGADTRTPKVADVDTDEGWPADYMPVGDPRPQNK
jgi:hypothetical protein